MSTAFNFVIKTLLWLWSPGLYPATALRNYISDASVLLW